MHDDHLEIYRIYCSLTKIIRGLVFGSVSVVTLSLSFCLVSISAGLVPNKGSLDYSTSVSHNIPECFHDEQREKDTGA